MANVELSKNIEYFGNNNIPVVGLGTYEELDEQVLVNSVKSAIKNGYRHFDCAYFYGNEQHIGKGFREAIEESNGELKREDLFIVSKVWNTFHSRAKVREALSLSLKNFQLDYLDLLLIHWPFGFKEDTNELLPQGPDGKMLASDVHYIETYQAMEELVDEGKLRFIGISNFNIEQVDDILRIARIKPLCNQFEIHPFFHNTKLVEHCEKNGIVVVAYAPLGSPSYCDRPELKPKEPPFKNPLIIEIAKKHNKSPVQVILRWLIQRNIVVIPKSVTPSRIAENINLFDFELSKEEMDVFKSFEQFRFNRYDSSNNHKLYPFEK